MSFQATSHYRFVYWLHIGLMIPVLVVSIGLWFATLVTQSLVTIQASGGYWTSLISLVITAPMTIGVGLWCLYRAKGNVVGALLVLWGCGIITIVSTYTYQSNLLIAFNYLYSWVGWPALFFLVVYFPNGAVFPVRFSLWADRLVILTYVGGFLNTLATAKEAGQSTLNPLHIALLDPLQPLLINITGLSLLAASAIGLRSLFLQFRSGNPRVRQQIKWLLWGTLPVLLTVLLQPLLAILFNSSGEGSLSQLIGYITQTYLRFLPVIAVGNAILRHRLYDIDIIIRRTLIYSVLTTILGIVYFGGIVLTQQVFVALTGETSDLAIVGSTLLIAALFTPIRRRVQAVIDRRLYRRKYDVEQTLAAFQRNLREDVDMETLKANLIAVVSDTMQPDKIALWVKPTESQHKERIAQ